MNKKFFLRKSIASFALILSFILPCIVGLADENINDYIIGTDSEFVSLSNGGAKNDKATNKSKIGINALKFYNFGTGGYICIKPYIYTGGKYRVKFYNYLRDDGVDVKLRAWENGKNDIDTPVSEVSFSQLINVEEESWIDMGIIEIPGGDTLEFTLEPDDHNNKNMEFSGKTLFFTQMILEQVETTEMSQRITIPGEISSSGSENNITLPIKNGERPIANADAYKIYVCAGSDGDGSENNPFGTVEEAQKKARAISALGYPASGINVIIDDGTYYIEDGLEFTFEDSGTEAAPVIYEAKEGSKPVFMGAKEVSDSLLRDLPDDVKANFNGDYVDKIKYFDLSDIGLSLETHEASGIVVRMIDSGYELARYPNVGYTRDFTIAGSISSMTPPNRLAEGYTYRLDIPHTAGYNKELTEANVRLHGDMAVIWDVDTDVKVENFSKESMTVMTRLGSGSSYHLSTIGSFYIYNAVEEIDVPGEFVVDYTTGRIYVYPKDDKSLHVTTKTKSLISFGDNSKNIVLKNLNAKYNNGDIISMIGGNNPSSFIKIVGGEFSDSVVTRAAINVGGENNSVYDCDVHDITGGLASIVLGGSEAKWQYTLLPSNHIVENNVIYNSQKGISIQFANNCVIRNNYIYHTAMTPIEYIGISEVIEYNLIENGAYASDDVGGIYSYSGVRGDDNVVRYNIINEVLGKKLNASIGIYNDDGSSGIEAYGNVILNARGTPFLNNSGDYNTFDNNLIYVAEDAENRSIYGSNFYRTKYTQRYLDEIQGAYNTFIKYAGEERFKTKYPRMYEFLSTTTGNDLMCSHCVFKNNACFNATEAGIASDNKYAEESKKSTFKFWENNEYFDDAFDVHDLSKIDFDRIREKIPSFQDIPIGEIGIYHGGERTASARTHVYTKPQTTNVFTPVNNDNLLDTNVNFSWEDKISDGAAEYNLYISESKDFDINVRKYTCLTNSLTLRVMPGKTYYWFVETVTKLHGNRAINIGGIQSFTTNSLDGLAEEAYMKYHFLAVDSVAGNNSGNFSLEDRESALAKDSEFYAKINDSEFEITQDFCNEIEKAYNDYISKEILPNDRIQFYDDFSFDEIGYMPNGLKKDQNSQRAGYEVIRDEENQLNSILKIEDNNFSNAGMTGNIGKFFNPNDSVDASVNVKISTANAFSMNIGYNGTAALAVEFINGTIYADANQKYPLSTYEKDTWYKVRVAANIRKKTYDVYIDGILAASDIEMLDSTALGTVSCFNYVFFASSDVKQKMVNDTGISYIDNIIIKTSSTGDRVNVYPENIMINSKLLDGFNIEKTVYNLNMTKEEMDGATINVKTSDIGSKSFVVNGKYAKYIVIKSIGNKTEVYRLVANKQTEVAQ